MRECMNEVKNLLKAKIQCIWIDTYEENAVINDLRELTGDMVGMKLYSWSHMMGLQKVPLSSKEKVEPADKKIDLQKIFITILQAQEDMSSKNESIWVLKDLHLINDTHQVKRALRDTKEKTGRNYNPIIVVSPIVNIPIEHEKLFTVVHYDTPNVKEIEKQVDRTILSITKAIEKGKDYTIPSDKERKSIINACKGLTMNQIIDTLAKSAIEYKTLSLKAIMNEKIQLVEKSGVLDYIMPDVNFEDIGGNHDFKNWIEEIEDSMSNEAVEFGCKRPKGFLSLGIPGTSKTMFANAIAKKWGMPLIKLSPSKIFDKLVGNSEKKIDQAFRVAKACAPCVLLIDECEKLLAGTKSSNSTDGGTSARVFGTVLQYLSEDNGVFAVLTSNDVSQLPPELTRSGRLDAMWYFSLPSLEERREIYRIHLGKTKKEISEDLIETCANASNNFTGAEIEQSVIAGMRKAYKRFKQDGNNAVIEEDMLDAISEIIPIYESSKERIMYLEQWARGRARFTNSSEEDYDFNYMRDEELQEGLNGLIE